MKIDEATRGYIPYRQVVAESRVYPTLAAGATVITSAANWTYGAYAQIIPAATIPTAFDITHITIETCNAQADAVYQLQLYKGTLDDLIATIRFSIYSGFYGNSVYLVSSERIDAGERVRARVASSNGLAEQATFTISVGYYQEEA